MIHTFERGLVEREITKSAGTIDNNVSMCVVCSELWSIDRNYGPTILPQMEAVKKGYSQVRNPKTLKP